MMKVEEEEEDIEVVISKIEVGLLEREDLIIIVMTIEVEEAASEEEEVEAINIKDRDRKEMIEEVNLEITIIIIEKGMTTGEDECKKLINT